MAPARRPVPLSFPTNVTTPHPELERRLLELTDEIEEPVPIATAIRGRDGRILDFPVELGDGYISTGRQRASAPEPG